MAQKKEEAPPGAPAWVMTFADLMSLLMCFFVLLLSFSEMDRKKYKQVAGSMAMAFGVQREVPTLETPKGVTIIAQEYAPGKPQPTLERVLRQETTDDTQDYLEVLEAIDRVQEKEFGEERGLLKGDADNDNKTPGHKPGKMSSSTGGDGAAGQRPGSESQQADGMHAGSAQGMPGGNADGMPGGDAQGAGGGEGSDPLSGELARLLGEEKLKDVEDEVARGDDDKDGGGDGDGSKTAQEIAKEALELERARLRAIVDAKKQAEALRRALGREVEADLLTIEAKDQGVLVKIREQGSFPSGQATLNSDFLPVLRKIAGAIISPNSEIVVAGHTDNIPISTGRFPSNWELSAARASSVVQGFIRQKLLAPDRLQLRAYGETRPLVRNDSRANRAKNRRVEIFINTLPVGDPELAEAARSIAVTADSGFEI